MNSSMNKIACNVGKRINKRKLDTNDDRFSPYIFAAKMNIAKIDCRVSSDVNRESLSV